MFKFLTTISKFQLFRFRFPFTLYVSVFRLISSVSTCPPRCRYWAIFLLTTTTTITLPLAHARGVITASEAGPVNSGEVAAVTVGGEVGLLNRRLIHHHANPQNIMYIDRRCSWVAWVQPYKAILAREGLLQSISIFLCAHVISMYK